MQIWSFNHKLIQIYISSNIIHSTSSSIVHRDLHFVHHIEHPVRDSISGRTSRIEHPESNIQYLVKSLFFGIWVLLFVLCYFQNKPASMNVPDFNCRVIFQKFSQFGNVNIHATGHKVIVVAPKFVQSLFAG
jgi:hypothetical protein